MIKHALAPLLIGLALAMSTAPTLALAGDRHLLMARKGGDSGVSLDDAVQQVRRDTGGRVLSASTVSQGGRRVHRIKVLTPAGHVRVVEIDARDGGR